jgi:hypothetical protein
VEVGYRRLNNSAQAKTRKMMRAYVTGSETQCVTTLYNVRWDGNRQMLQRLRVQAGQSVLGARAKAVTATAPVVAARSSQQILSRYGDLRIIGSALEGPILTLGLGPRTALCRGLCSRPSAVLSKSRSTGCSRLFTVPHKASALGGVRGYAFDGTIPLFAPGLPQHLSSSSF